MTELERLEFLLKYHTNLTKQMFVELTSGHATLNQQITRVEAAIESILFPIIGDENES